MESWVPSDLVKKIDEASSISDLMKAVTDGLSKLDKSKLENPDESFKKLDGKLKEFVEGKDKDNPGLYISPEDAVKRNKKLAEDVKNGKDSTNLGDGIKSYIQRKLTKKDNKSAEEEELARDNKLLELRAKKARSDSRYNMAKAAISGMEEPGKSFVEGIIDMFKTNSDIKHGIDIAPLVEQSESTAKDLPKELEIKDDDIELTDEESDGKDESKKSKKESKSDKDTEAAKPKKSNKAKDQESAKAVSFSETDPMDSILEGHIDTISNKNFSLTEEFKEYEKSLNDLWDFR
jgi:hypothetical protein